MKEAGEDKLSESDVIAQVRDAQCQLYSRFLILFVDVVCDWRLLELVISAHHSVVPSPLPQWIPLQARLLAHSTHSL
jgi:hypothetical protein